MTQRERELLPSMVNPDCPDSRRRHQRLLEIIADPANRNADGAVVLRRSAYLYVELGEEGVDPGADY